MSYIGGKRSNRFHLLARCVVGWPSPITPIAYLSPSSIGHTSRCMLEREAVSKDPACTPHGMP